MMEAGALAIFFAAANWLAGGNLSWRKRLGLPGRSVYYAAALLAIVLTPAYGWPGFAVGVNFLWWRLPGWYGAIDAGTMPAANAGQSRLLWMDMAEHMRARDFIVMSARGFVAAPFFLWSAWNAGEWAPVAVLAIVAVWQGVAYELAHRALWRDNAHAELLAGAGWGLAYFTLLA